jgi:NTE family protein
MLRSRTALLAILCLGATAYAQAPAEPTPPSAGWPSARPRLALALSGGGARGIAHVGALRALEEAQLPVDGIAANSMGAIVGGIYATGLTAAELEAIVLSLDWASLFSGRPDRRTLPVVRRDDRFRDLVGVSFDGTKARFPAGLVAEHRVNRFLIEHLAPASYAAGGDFDRLAIPFRAVATDLASGERVILAKGDLARAVRASMSIPVFFPPVDWEARKLVDGLVVNNLPTDVAKAFGAAVTLAIDISSPPLEPDGFATSLGVATQVSNLLSGRRSLDFTAKPDVLVRPDLGTHSATDYSDFDVLIQAGYEATKQAIPQIREKLAQAFVSDLAASPRSTAGRALEGAPIAEVVARGNERVSEALLRRTFNIPTGPDFSMERGLRAFDKVDATGLLERSWMEFEPAGEGVRIVLLARDAPRNRAGVGIGYSEWEKARASVRLRNQNTLGFGERVELLLAASDALTLASASLRGDRLFVAGFGYRAEAYSFTDKPRYFEPDGDELNRAKFERQGLRGALQTSLERWGFVEGGIHYGRVKVRQQAGVPLLEASDKVALLYGAITLDTLDDLLWPRAGGRLALQGEWNLDGMGATYSYWRLRAEGRFGRPIAGKGSFHLDGLVGLSGDALQAYDYFRVGGPMLIPGYHHEELKGAQTLAGSLSLRYPVFGQFQFLARAGAGNVFENPGDIGLQDVRWGVGIGVYFPSRIGPISAEVGMQDDGRSLFSLVVGWQ